MSNTGITVFDLARFAGKPCDALKMLIRGELEAGGGDHRCVVRFNGHEDKYHSFLTLEGNAEKPHLPEWDDCGLVVGRNSLSLDARFDIIVSLTCIASTNMRVALGNATFTHSNGVTASYHSHGYLSDPRPIDKIECQFTGGFVRGSLECYALL